MNKRSVAIIGSGNIGTDLMIKILRTSESLQMGAMVGIDPESDGLKRAQRMRVDITSGGVEGLMEMDVFEDIDIVFDATSAGAHAHHDAVLREHGKRVIDLTPAAIGPFVVPVVNLEEHLDVPNINMVTCGGQATVPIVAAVSHVAPVLYAEIVSSIASKSAGPGTRANIDEFTETTAAALESVGGAMAGKAIIILNPADPPLLMRNTVYCLVGEDSDEDEIEASIVRMTERVQAYVKGYRLKQRVQFTRFDTRTPLEVPRIGFKGGGVQVSVFLEVTGAAHYLPAYAGNLDIMTSAAQRTGEKLVELESEVVA